MEQPTEPSRTNIDEITQQTNDDVLVTPKTQKKTKILTTKTNKRPPETSEYLITRKTQEDETGTSKSCKLQFSFKP